MTVNEFYQKALLQIASNSAFGNGHGSYVDYVSWAKKIHEAAEALSCVAERHSHFGDNETEQPP